VYKCIFLQADVEWQVFGCSKDQVTLADVTSAFTMACLSGISGSKCCTWS
jgi:hypothetical protein